MGLAKSIIADMTAPEIITRPGNNFNLLCDDQREPKERPRPTIRVAIGNATANPDASSDTDGSD